MARWSDRLWVVLFALLVATGAPRVAFASFPWVGGCSGVAGADIMCIYRDWHYESNVAHDNGDNASYQGETWPSSSLLVQNSVSSAKNLYDDLRVKWYVGRNYSGGSLCNQPNEGIWYVGIVWNDEFESHDLTGQVC